MNLVIVYGQEDWAGLYVDGRLEQEGHSLRLTSVLELLHERAQPIASIDWRTLNDAGELSLNTRGCMPPTLVEIDEWEKR